MEMMTTVAEPSIRKPGRSRGVQADQSILSATVGELVAVGFEALSVEAVAARWRLAARSDLFQGWLNGLLLQRLQHFLALASRIQ